MSLKEDEQKMGLSGEWVNKEYADQLEARIGELEGQLDRAIDDRSNVMDQRNDAEARIEELRAALETICDIGETRDVEVARAALSPAPDPKTRGAGE